MEGLGVAASCIAVADLSAKVAMLCLKYSTEVASARRDIDLLLIHVSGMEAILRNAGRLIQGTDRDSLLTSSELASHFEDFKKELEQLQTKLQLTSTRKSMSRFGLRALKWPFSRSEVDAIIKRLERFQSNITSSLQIDQTYGNISSLLVHCISHTDYLRTLLLGISKGIEGLSIKQDMHASPPRKPSIRIPFAQDANFVTRPSIQTWLQDQFASSTSRIALIGLGGFG
jgi:hypothetical protein